MKHYSYILFDWDGCLAMSLDVWLKAYKEVFAEYNAFPTDREIALYAFGDWNGPKKFGIDDVEAFAQKMLVKINEKYGSLQLYPEVKATLETLRKKNKKLALVTTSKESLVNQALTHHKLTSVFDVILTAESVTKHKPDPESLEKALQELKADKESSIMIGDSKSDLGAAQNANIDSILFYPKHNHIFYDLDHLTSYKPTYTVTRFEEILTIV